MNENFELLEHIYKDCDMAIFTLTDLLNKIKDKDNKIKGSVEDVLKEYEYYLKEVEDILTSHDIKLERNGAAAKMGAMMGISKEVKNDNSDSSMADLLIQGIQMGSLDMEKKIKNYDKEVDKSDLKIAKKFLEFQQDSIEKFKKYL